VFATPKNYHVKLKVQDSAGAESTVSHDVVVTLEDYANQPPIAVFSAQSQGLQVAFDAAASSDPDGTLIFYQWSFGDGSLATGQQTSHTYAVTGNYTVTLKVTDNKYKTISATRTIAAGTGAAPFSTLPDTGQTKCYDNTSEIPCPSTGQPFYGQDANYTINQPAYTPHGDTVTDNVTGLMWQREDDNITRTWDAAMGYCQDSGLGGYNDWRLPSKKELMGLVNYNIPYPGPTIDTNAFPGTNYWCWSSTTYAYVPGFAWSVYFYYGFVNYNGKGYNGYVRCVRGGQ
jgi:PKD repeat protein